MAKLPCFLCTVPLEQRTDKNSKPYFICDDCGTQYFVRKNPGIERLSSAMKTPKKQKKAGPAKAPAWLKDGEELRGDMSALLAIAGNLPDEQMEEIEEIVGAMEHFILLTEEHFGQ